MVNAMLRQRYFQERAPEQHGFGGRRSSPGGGIPSAEQRPV